MIKTFFIKILILAALTTPLVSASFALFGNVTTANAVVSCDVYKDQNKSDCEVGFRDGKCTNARNAAPCQTGVDAKNGSQSSNSSACAQYTGDMYSDCMKGFSGGDCALVRNAIPCRTGLDAKNGITIAPDPNIEKGPSIAKQAEDYASSVCATNTTGIQNCNKVLSDAYKECVKNVSVSNTSPENYQKNLSTCLDQLNPSASGASRKILDEMDKDERDPNKGVTCAIEKMGWMLCPILETVAKISDGAFRILANDLLQVEPELLGDSNDGTKAAWEAFRNIANLMFIIAFIVIIYSQITGLGLSNYGIKRMIPRLIIAAVAVNVSYYICQVIVDVTNILGFELNNWLKNMAKDIYEQSVNPYAKTLATGNLPLTALTVVALGAAAAWVFLPILGSVLLFVFISLLMVIIILLLRKAIIVALVVISPVAFVAYLLPNTENYFKQWRKMFITLLLVFPTISLLFGIGQLASAVIMNSGQNYSTPAADNSLESIETSGGEFTSDKEGSDLSMGLVATALAIIPLFAVLGVIKGALASAGAVGAVVNRLGKKATDKGSERGKAMDANSAYNRGAAMRLAGKKNYDSKKVIRRLGEDSLAGKYTRLAFKGTGAVIPGKIQAGGMKNVSTRIERLSVIAAKKIEDEEINDLKSNMTASGMDISELAKAYKDAMTHGMSDSADLTAKAAASLLASGRGEGGLAALESAIIASEATGGNDEQVKEVKRFLVEKHPQIEDKSASLAAWTQDETSTKPLADYRTDAESFSHLSDKEIATQTAESLELMKRAIDRNTGTPVLNKQVAQRILASDSAENLSDVKRSILNGIR